MPGLYDPRFEHDACGIGFVADASGTASRRSVDAAIEGLCGVMHRGAVAADEKSGDGAGLLLPLPRDLLAREVATAADPAVLGVAMCFVHDGLDTVRKAVDAALAASGLQLCGWLDVPVEPDTLGDQSRAAMPKIVQAVFARPADTDPDLAERRCYLARKRAERACRDAGASVYFASWSLRTVTYKAMSRADQLAAFYPDLTDRSWTAWFGIFHQRYSTNTLPTWERAQPFRYLCHKDRKSVV
jgi:glutamate synthase domain-containing protein 1